MPLPRFSRLMIGSLLWVASLQYYIVQLWVASAWSNRGGYSWANNTISDLANTRCGMYGSRLVCSPLHSLMNGSFLLLGLTMFVGALLLRRELSTGRLSDIGFASLGLAGVGTIVVGLFPENTISGLHIIGAALPFVLGNLAMVLLAISLDWQSRSLRRFSFLSGGIGLVALLLFVANIYLGLGVGGMERFVSYPQSIWMITVGAYLIFRNQRHLSKD